MNVRELTTTLLESIYADRLVILAGAGLSMAKPSVVPSAAEVARHAADSYETLFDVSIEPEIRGELEPLARWFYEKNRLSSLFIDRLIEWSRFRSRPNRGHEAVADLLMCGAIQLAITTNFDDLVENAARSIGEPDFQSSLDGEQASRKVAHQPYLKIYGCCAKDRQHTVWCREQILDEPIHTMLAKSKEWLAGNLMNRDLLVIGFWSDWSYLNSILASALPAGSNGQVYLVDPDRDEALMMKAPLLWDWAVGHEQFVHVSATADEVLETLRSRFSRLLLRRVMKLAGEASDFAWVENLAASDAFAIRRDLAGVDGPARDRAPAVSMTLFAREHYQMNKRGGLFASGSYTLDGQRVRIVQAAGQLLSEVRKDFAGAFAGSVLLDSVVCAGALDDGGAVSNIVRSETEASVLRGGSSGLRFVSTMESLPASEES